MGALEYENHNSGSGGNGDGGLMSQSTGKNTGNVTTSRNRLAGSGGAEGEEINRLKGQSRTRNRLYQGSRPTELSNGLDTKGQLSSKDRLIDFDKELQNIQIDPDGIMGGPTRAKTHERPDSPLNRRNKSMNTITN